jgi:hypothetical protein
MAQRMPFIVAELGRDADPFMLHLFAALAEGAPIDLGADEGGAASEQRGRRPVGKSGKLDQAGLAGRAVQARAADVFAAGVLPNLRAVRKAGASTLAEIAEALNERGIRSAGGGVWHRSSVRNLLARAQSSEA